MLRYSGQLLVAGEDERPFYYITRAEMLRMVRNLRENDSLVISTVEKSDD